MSTTTLPRENLLRFTAPGIRLRGGDATRSGDPFTADPAPGIVGHFAVFNRWTEINSLWEGNFLERIAPGSFRKTMKDNRDGIRVLFQHGRDPQAGDKPLGPIEDLSEDDFGARYDVTLLDTSYNRDLIPGLQAGLYGASFRFRVVREDMNFEPKPSDYNPAGIPERTIREASVSEFGPVTFPAYADATAGMRSMTDEILIERFAADPERLRQLLERVGRNGTGVPMVKGDGDDLCAGCVPDCPCPANETPGASCTCTCAGCRPTDDAGNLVAPRSAPVPGITPAKGAGLTATPDARRESPSARPLVVIRNPRRSRKVIES